MKSSYCCTKAMQTCYLMLNMICVLIPLWADLDACGVCLSQTSSINSQYMPCHNWNSKYDEMTCFVYIL